MFLKHLTFPITTCFDQVNQTVASSKICSLERKQNSLETTLLFTISGNEEGTLLLSILFNDQPVLFAVKYRHCCSYLPLQVLKSSFPVRDCLTITEVRGSNSGNI